MRKLWHAIGDTKFFNSTLATAAKNFHCNQAILPSIKHAPGPLCTKNYLALYEMLLIDLTKINTLH